ncbi:MAG: type II secretion system protein GspM, partial [Pseudomonadota bacterium]|nr:type II secretion system protein GspM [Pseudomonadota bacterium]
VVLGTAWLGIARPLIGAFASQRHELERAVEARATLARILAERPSLEQRREALDTAEAEQHLTLAAESDGVAAAALQRLVKTAVDRSGATLQSTQVKAVRPDGAFRRIGLRMQMTGTVEALRQTLLTLEANQPLIYGEGLELRSRQQMRSNGKSLAEDRTLEIRLDVYGLARLPS